MDTSNWRPTPGGNAGGGDSSMEADDWRSKLQEDSREMILNNIVGTLKRRVPFSGHEELKKIAMRFEEKIYNAATSQSDYLHKISLKMLSMESGPQNHINSAANCVNPSDPGLQSIIKQEMETSDGRHTPGGSAVGGDSSMESGDWRSTLQADSRESILNNIVDTLKRHVPFSGHEELKKIVMTFEDNIYIAATSQSDYQHKISLKMLTMETILQKPMPDARQSNSAANCVNPSDPDVMAGVERHESNHSDDENPMPSYIPEQPSVNAQNPDDQLILRSDFLELKPNNHKLDFSMRSDYPVILEILKGHPLKHALSTTAHTPLIYLQQFWKTLKYISEENNYHFEAKVDHFQTMLTKKMMRRVLSLPEKNEFPGKEDYDDFASESDLCADILSLGYSQPLTSARKFKRMYLPPIWYTLFSIINRCLTSKHTGLDRCSISVLRLFHGVAFNKHYDYSTIFWNELVELVSDKSKPSKARTFVPYQRFLLLFVRSMLRSNREIPKRLSAPACPDYTMQYLKITRDESKFPNTLPIPEALLAYADQNAACVREFRNLDPPMVQPEPEGLAHGAISRLVEGGEVSRQLDEQDQEMRVLDPGETSENVNERGITGDGDASDVAVDAVIILKHNIPKENPNVHYVSSHDESTEDESVGDANNDSSDDDDDGANPNMHVPEMHLEQVITKITTTEEEAEGIIVENSERVCDGTQKEYGERETGSKESEDPHQSESVTRVATSTIGFRVLESGIEKDVMDLVTHVVTPPSHSVISQRMCVSDIHEGLAQNLSTSHLENVAIEQGRKQLRSPTSFVTQSSLGPDTELRTLSLSTACLTDISGTPRVVPSIGISRGQGGRPTKATIMPTLNVGHTVDSTVVSTGIQSGPGVNIPEFVSREILDGALKAIQRSFMEQFDSLKRLYKGKKIATDLPTPSPQPKPSEDLSVDELKSLLYAKLLSQAKDVESVDTDLIGVLRRQTEAATNVVTSDQLNSFKEEVTSSIANLSNIIKTSTESLQKTILNLSEKVQVLEDTCKAQVECQKRKHDDPDHNEGENKRQKMTEDTSGGTESIESGAIDDNTGNIQNVGNVQGVDCCCKCGTSR